MIKLKQNVKIISFEKLNTKTEQYLVWYETPMDYQETILRDEKIEVLNTIKKTNYRDYDHFVGVRGKFAPETFFLKNPIDVKFNYDNSIEMIRKIINS